jgi:hypothetical protein
VESVAEGITVEVQRRFIRDLSLATGLRQAGGSEPSQGLLQGSQFQGNVCWTRLATFGTCYSTMHSLSSRAKIISKVAGRRFTLPGWTQRGRILLDAGHYIPQQKLMKNKAKGPMCIGKQLREELCSPCIEIFGGRARRKTNLRSPCIETFGGCARRWNPPGSPCIAT